MRDYLKDMNQKATSHAYPRQRKKCTKLTETRPTEEGTVFETTINNTKMKALFDTGATKKRNVR